MGTTLERARRLVHELGEATTPEQYVQVVVAGIWDLFPNDEMRCEERNPITEVVYLERTQSELSLWTDLPQVHDDTQDCPTLPLREATVIRMTDRMFSSQLHTDPVYRELLEPLGCRYVVRVQFHQRTDTCCGLGVARSDRDFTDEEVDLLILLAPHLEAEYRRATVASKLTPREREVVALVGHGLTNREIARHLHVAPGTVRAHLEHAYAKLGVGSRTGAMAALG